jgi:hypothetical protein
LKRIARPFLFPLGIAALAVGAFAQSVHHAGEAPELIVEAPPELAGAASRLKGIDRTRLVAVARLLGIDDPGPPIAVVLATETSELGRTTPPWIAGFADGRRDLIVMFPARAPTYPSESFEELLHHEVVHVLIARAARGAEVPRWFHEGLAMAAERSWRFEDHTRFAVAVVSERRSIRQIDADFDGGPERAARAYGVAGAFVRDLLRQYGPGFPARVLAAMARGTTFEQGFLAATGTPLAEAEREFWRNALWHQLVPWVTSTLVIWMGIVLLALYAMRRRLAHRRATRRRWEEEERALDTIEASTTPRS